MLSWMICCPLPLAGLVMIAEMQYREFTGNKTSIKEGTSKGTTSK